MFEQLSDWLSTTYLSALFTDTTHLSTWLIVPLSQTVHILGVAVVMICAGVLNLRMLGIAGTRQTFPELASSLTPWIWGGLIALLVTGVVQTIAEPARELLNIGFKTKIVLLLGTVAVTLYYERTAKKDPGYWDRSPERRSMGRALAVASLAAWIGIASLGRLIAYI